MGWGRSIICEGLRVEPLLLCIESCKMRSLRHLIRMPNGCLPEKVLRACHTRRKPQGRPRTRCKEIRQLVGPGNASGFPRKSWTKWHLIFGLLDYDVFFYGGRVDGPTDRLADQWNWQTDVRLKSHDGLTITVWFGLKKWWTDSDGHDKWRAANIL